MEFAIVIIVIVIVIYRDVMYMDVPIDFDGNNYNANRVHNANRYVTK
ncbi:MAG: hypothetical protein LUG23_00755 [Oscillospiraceae bacterium]|nr:hypothetical protein [Oscillospiraceae bacterium]